MRRFVTAAQHAHSLETHAVMVLDAIKALRANGIKAKDTRRLNFFFATNTQKKAQALVQMLEVSRYDVLVVQDKNKFLITGLTPPIPMSQVALGDWSTDMVHLAFEFDSLFDGWNLEG